MLADWLIRTSSEDSEAAEAANGGAGPGRPAGSLVELLQRTPSCYLTPAQFFVSWQGVLTLAYTGWPRPLVRVKRRLDALHKALPAEAPGSRWPKTSLAALKDGCRLTPDQLALLTRLARESSAWGSPPAQVLAERCLVALYECRSLERLVAAQEVPLLGAVDTAGPPPEERQRIQEVLAEADEEGYWFAASRDGNRASHYTDAHLGATLVIPLGLHHTAARGAPAPGLPPALAAALRAFRERVERALPGMYHWFADESLHVTLRAIMG